MRKIISKFLSDWKIWILRREGARIGQNVIIQKGAKIQCSHIDIADDVVIGPHVTIQAKHLKLGRLSFLGRNTHLRAERITFGENVFVNKNVEIGGGGAQDPESAIEIGSHCHIGEDVHLNCCRKITIGEETTISMRAMVMTHSFANSMLEGYPAIFSPVQIGNHVQIGLQAVIFPGVSIGDYAVVGSNSNVIASVPSGKIAMGVPARVIGDAKKNLKPQRQERMAYDLVNAFLTQIALKGINVHRHEDTRADIMASIKYQGGQGLIIFSKEFSNTISQEMLTTGDECTVISLHSIKEGNFNAEFNVIELLDKKISGPGGVVADSFREFLRKRGIRLEPRTWTYTGGLI